MIIKIKTKTEIMWIIVLLYLLKTYVLSAELFFMLCLFIIGLYTIRKQAVVIPKIPCIVFYALTLVIAAVVGMTKYPISLIERDVFYEFFSILYLFIGYYSFDYYRDRDKSLWKTVCLILFIISILCVVQGIGSVSSGADFAAFREQFSQSVGSISLMIPLLAGKMYIYKETTFSRVRDNGLLALWILQILLNLSRISIINICIGIIVFIICGVYKRRLNFKNSFRVICLIFTIVAAGGIFVSVMPDDAQERFSEKFANSFAEINSKNEYNSLSSAQNDWRGYEINCAQEQWKNSNIGTQLVGAGNGTLVYIHYVPDQWKETVEIQNGRVGVTILHNTYYTLLIKGGLLAVIALLTFFAANIRKAYKVLSISYNENVIYATMLIALVCLIMVDAYVIRNMMDKGSEMMALLLIGWINAKFNQRERNHDR